MSENTLWSCPACGAGNVLDDLTCFACGQPRYPGAPAPVQLQPPVPAVPLEPGVIPGGGGPGYGKWWYRAAGVLFAASIACYVAGSAGLLDTPFDPWRSVWWSVAGLVGVIGFQACVTAGLMSNLAAATDLSFAGRLAASLAGLGCAAAVAILAFAPDAAMAAAVLGGFGGTCGVAASIRGWKAEQGTLLLVAGIAGTVIGASLAAYAFHAYVTDMVTMVTAYLARGK